VILPGSRLLLPKRRPRVIKPTPKKNPSPNVEARLVLVRRTYGGH
jgi:hypothetical protein